MKKTLFVFMAAVMLAIGTNAAFEKVNTYEGNFADVKSDAWYANYVKTAYELGFMNGKSDTAFDPNGNVTVVEGIAMASRLHAIYNGNEIKAKERREFRFDFDDPSILVDLTVRNSRNDNGINFVKAKGEIKNGILVAQADGYNSHGSYDPGIKFEGLDIDTAVYDTLVVRMKRDELPNKDPSKKRSEKIEVFFETTSAQSITGDKCVTYDLKDIKDLSEWFEVEIDLSKHKNYKDHLTGMRFDTTNNNGIYYIDYILFVSSDKVKGKWYDMYVDYAVDNGIVHKSKYFVADYNKNISRAELCDLFASALPSEYFNPINDIKGIPDVTPSRANSDVYLMLYKAGVLLGSDANGTFNGESDVKRSEVAAIINRAALPENRVKGSISADWAEYYSDYDLGFDDMEFSDSLVYEAAEGEIKDGTLILKAVDRGEERKVARFDPRIVSKNINVDASQFTKVRVRMKADFAEPIANPSYDFYFMTEGDTGFSEAKSIHSGYGEYNVDASGWMVFEIDFRTFPGWKGNVTAFRFDPANSDGTYTIDYLRFVKGDHFKYQTHEELLEAGFTATRLLKDEGFERGFWVSRVTNTASSTTKGKWQDYCETKEAPLWNISPHWARYDLVDDRDTTKDKYTLADKHGVSTLTYNPEEKSMTMRVNTYPCYEGKPHIQDDKSTPDVDEGNYEWWPHLLLSQDSSICPFDKKRNSAAADRMFIECDIRLLDFKDTTIKEGLTSANFMAYFYLRTDKAPGDLIWFGINFFNGTRVDSSLKCGWSPDSGAHQYMYKMSQAIVFKGVENSFVPEKGVVLTGEEWKHIRFDVTPHIEEAVEWANRDNAFGVPVTVEDMYFEGVNIGYETWGSFDYTVEFKNFNMVSYNKD